MSSPVELKCADCGVVDRTHDPALSGVRFVHGADRVLCGDCMTAFYANLPSSSTTRSSSPSPTRSWPTPMSATARHGFVGELLDLIEPHTEADPHAILVQLLVAFGNVIGRGAGFRAEADFHSTALYTLVVGETSKGRKGTSLGYIRRLIATADSEYVEHRIEGGLSSGEGLVYAVRDATTKLVPPGKEDDGDEWTEQLVDPGVGDKRLLVLEGEFAQVLKVMARPGNTLSPAMRNLWDHGKAGAVDEDRPHDVHGRTRLDHRAHRAR